MTSLRLWLGALVLITAYAVGLAGQAYANPGPMVKPRLVLTLPALTALVRHDPSLAARFDSGYTFVLTRTGHTLPETPHAVATRCYRDFNEFASDLQRHVLDGDKAVAYDPEHWAATPTPQQTNPSKYEQLFAAAARLHGLYPIIAPARSLVPAGMFNQRAMAKKAAAALAGRSGIVSIPTQRDQASPAAFTSFYRIAHTQALLVNRRVVTIAAISEGLYKGYATPRQLGASIARSLGVIHGYWISLAEHDARAISYTSRFLGGRS
jgi:hypothetical protein